jgi:phosphatidylethanolamine-binding protein (PEBP) family uncharacterized protein
MEAVAPNGVLDALPANLAHHSPPFANGGRIPQRFTADGDGQLPMLEWNEPPPRTSSRVLLVEDADSPTPKPLMHCIIYGLSPGTRSLSLPDVRYGKNSFFKSAWLPPDPPTGQGEHRYVFQLYALDAEPAFKSPGRSELIAFVKRHGLGKGVLIGVYARN